MFLSVVLLLIASLAIESSESAGAVKLSSANFDSTLSGSELVFVNFYANWCRFSQMLEPIYDELADKIAKEYPASKVTIAKVDCDSETAIAQAQHINKYPTLKLYRYGVAAKKEYRGARSVDAFHAFIKEQSESKLKIVRDSSELAHVALENKKRTIIGYFHSSDEAANANYRTFAKLANLLRDSCLFVAACGDLASMHGNPNEQVTFKDLSSAAAESTERVFEAGQLSEYEKVYAWADEQCTPLVREITFENAEELTEEGLPFLILFRKPEDASGLQRFEKQVQLQLGHLKSTINAVYADGNKFTHPLHHLGKTVADLPLLAIDSFRHMYLFPDFGKIDQANHLAQFVQDLHNGKLHREFHNGPDPTAAPAQQIELHVGGGGNSQHIPKTSDQPSSGEQRPSQPPESVFIKLAPSRDRYSIKYDGEL